MHAALGEIQDQLKAVIKAIPGSPYTQPNQYNGQFPILTRPELVQEAQSIIDLIEERTTEDLNENAQNLLESFVLRLTSLSETVAPHLWKQPQIFMPTYLLTLQVFHKRLDAALPPLAEVVKKTSDDLKRVTKRVHSMDSRLNEIEPKTASLAKMIASIEEAHDAADQLPVDLEMLARERGTIQNLLDQATVDQEKVAKIRDDVVNNTSEKIRGLAREAAKVMEDAGRAYAAATSVGLAKAFDERAKESKQSMRCWGLGLIAALATGGFFGSSQLRSLAELIKTPDAPASIVVLNLLLSLLSVGAPVWFAWLATKQIGHRFRLSEDYAFKAAAATAYEGFRREAARFDNDMEVELLSSALARFDEPPLRLVETESHGSPWHELLSSHPVQQALKTIPGFANRMESLARDTLGKVKPPSSPRSQKGGKIVQTSAQEDDE